MNLRLATLTMIRLVFLTACLAFITAKPAHAYVDPGTASILLQGVIGAVAAGGIFFRHKIAQLMKLFARRQKPSSEAPVERNDR